MVRFRFFGSRNDSLVTNFTFEVDSNDLLGNPITDLVEDELDNNIAIFPAAIQNFEGVFESFGFLLDGNVSNTPDNAVNIGDPDGAFALANFLPFSSVIDVDDKQVEIPNPISLDLVAENGILTELSDDLSSFEPPNPTINYSFVGGGLDSVNITRFYSIVVDADGDKTNGLQVVVDKSSGNAIADESSEPGFQFEGSTINLSNINGALEVFNFEFEDAINDIDYILGNNPEGKSLFELVSFVGIEGFVSSESDPEESDLDRSEVEVNVNRFIEPFTISPII